MAPSLHLSLLGRFSATLDGQPVEDLRTTKAQALLAYLAVYRQPHSRHALAGLLWGEEADEDAKNNLRVTLANLNQLLPHHLESTRLTIALRSDQPVWLDLDEFQGKTAALAANPPAPDIPTLQAAAAIYRGDFLEDLYVANSPAFEEWLLAERERWRRTLMDVLETLADTLLAERRYTEAVATLRRLLNLEPWYEEGHRQLMLTLSRMGDFNAALAQYGTCRRVLAAELDVEPMTETSALHERIQVARQARPYPGPVEATLLIGRSRELTQLLRRLADPACRLITITGLGGVGKSSLALAAAHQANQEHALLFLNGVVFVPLAGVESSTDLPLVLAAALNLPLSGRSKPADELLAFLRNKEILLVLDNFEHLLPAGDPAAAGRSADDAQAGADLLAQMLRTSPYLKLLLTSREPLQLAAEWRLDLAGLPLPPQQPALASNDELLISDAVALFTQVAQQAQPSFQLSATNIAHVASLCRLVGGLPLAIKLAAAWLRIMSLDRIVAELEQNPDLLASRLRDTPVRQRSMRAIFAHTWRLLNVAEQRIFARLAVFRGSFDLAAAHEVAGASPYVLDTLRDRSLVQFQAGDRYKLPALLRQYGEEQLNSSPAEADWAREAHAAYYMRFLQQCGQVTLGGDQRAALVQIGLEIDNIRTAWRRAVQQGASQVIGPASMALCWFNDTRGYYLENVMLLTGAIQQLEELDDAAPALAHLQVHLGWANIRLGLLSEAHDLFTRSRTNYQRLGQPPPPGFGTDPLVGLSVLASIRGNFDEATRLSELAADAAQQRGDNHNLANALEELASVAFARGQYAVAATYGLHAIALLEAADNRLSLAYTLSQLGRVAQAQGDYANAALRYRRSYAIHQQMDSPGGTATNLNDLAQIAWLQDDLVSAQGQFEQALVLHRLINDRGGLAASLNGLGKCALAAGEFPLAAHHFSQALVIALEMDFAPLALAILCGAGELLLGANRAEYARTLLLFTANHPASDQETCTRATHLLAGSKGMLPSLTNSTANHEQPTSQHLAETGRQTLTLLTALALQR